MEVYCSTKWLNNWLSGYNFRPVSARCQQCETHIVGTRDRLILTAPPGGQLIDWVAFIIPSARYQLYEMPMIRTLVWAVDSSSSWSPSQVVSGDMKLTDTRCYFKNARDQEDRREDRIWYLQIARVLSNHPTNLAHDWLIGLEFNIP